MEGGVIRMKITRPHARVGDVFTPSNWSFRCGIAISAVGIITILVIIVLNAMPYTRREEYSRYNAAVAVYNQLPREERELLFDELFNMDSSEARLFNEEEYLFSTIEVAESPFDRAVIEGVIKGCIEASVAISLCYFACCVVLGIVYDKTFFLADMLPPLPYSLPLILLLFAMWPILVVSAIRLYRFQKNQTASGGPAEPETMEAAAEFTEA